MVQRRVAPGTEAGLAALTLQGLDIFSCAALSISDQRMYGCIDDTEIAAVWIGTGVALGSGLLLSPSPALAFRPGFGIALDGLNS